MGRTGAPCGDRAAHTLSSARGAPGYCAPFGPQVTPEAQVKLVVFGLSISSSWGNGHATLWRALCRALAQRGHRTVFFERDVPYYAAHRDVLAVDGVELVLYDDLSHIRRRA